VTDQRKPVIFYGLCGEGLGHYSRAAFLAPRLVEKGYSIEWFTSGRVADLCQTRFSACRVHRVPGLRMCYRANRLAVLQTYLNYIGLMLRLPLASFMAAWLAGRRRPVAVISDYEPAVAWMAWLFGVPLIALDHQQIATECQMELPSAIPGYELLCRSNRVTYPGADLRIITSFFRAPIRQRLTGDDAILIGPVLREEVVRRAPSAGSHVVVYQTSRSFDGLKRMLDVLPGEKRVYGTGTLQSGQPERPFCEQSFLDDLASCRFAIVNAGHTTISEALHYGKPVICLPVLGQAEQEINAHYIEKCGFGVSYRPEHGEVPHFRSFLARENDIRQTIAATAPASGNEELVQTVLDRLSRWQGGAA
jgi:uncharacterized protein (TIGR00661 family)